MEGGERALMPTPSQTIGPFFRIGPFAEDGSELVAPGSPGAIPAGA